MSTSLSASAHVGNASLPVFASATQTVGKPTSARNPNALDVLLITSTEGFFHSGAAKLESSAESQQVPMQTVFVEKLAGTNKEEKSAALKQQLEALHQSGKIDAHTQVIVHLHGSITDQPHELSNNKNEFSLGTRQMVSLIRESAVLPGQDVAADSWQGTIHLGACGAGRASQDLKDDAGITLLYAGRNVKFSADSGAIFKEIIRQLGEYRKDPAVNKFPSAQDFYAAAGAISGEKVHMVGEGNLFQIRSGYLPHPTDLTQTAVLEKLERSLVAKVSHGKPSTVQKMVDLLGPALKNIKEPPPILIALNEHTTDAEEKIKILLGAGVDINQQYSGGETALHVACRSGKKEIVSFLLRHGADARIANSKGETALMAAIDAADMDLFECLVAADADIDATTTHGNTALHLACEKGDIRLVSSLLRRSANPHCENKDLKTPVSNAIEAGHFEIAAMMLSDRSHHRKTVMDYDNSTLMAVLSSGQPVLLHQLIGMSPDKTSLMEKLFDILIAEIEPNYRSRFFDLNLFEKHKIMLSNFIREILYSNEGMPDYLKSLLMDTNFMNGIEYATYILSRPTFSDQLAADLEQVRSFYEMVGHAEACALFDAALELKATLSERVDRDLRQLDSIDASGFTPIEQACRENNLQKMKILTAAGADFKGDRFGPARTPLMAACQAGSLDVVTWLIAHGVDVSQRDEQGRTALEYATMSGNTEVAAVVRRYLPDSMAPSGNSAMQ